MKLIQWEFLNPLHLVELLLAKNKNPLPSVEANGQGAGRQAPLQKEASSAHIHVMTFTCTGSCVDVLSLRVLKKIRRPASHQSRTPDLGHMYTRRENTSSCQEINRSPPLFRDRGNRRASKAPLPVARAPAHAFRRRRCRRLSRQ